MKGFSLTEKELIELRIAHKKARRHDASSAYKINAIILLGTGWTAAKVKETLLLDEDTFPGNPDYEAQEVFAEQYEKFMLKKSCDVEVLFADAVHPPHNAMPSYGWIKNAHKFFRVGDGIPMTRSKILEYYIRHSL